MSHEVLITRRQSIFDFFANPGRGGPQHPNQPAPASTDLLRPASAWICKKIKNALSSGYQDLMGHLILTTSPWSVLSWITLIVSKVKINLINISWLTVFLMFATTKHQITEVVIKECLPFCQCIAAFFLYYSALPPCSHMIKILHFRLTSPEGHKFLINKVFLG